MTIKKAAAISFLVGSLVGGIVTYLVNKKAEKTEDTNYDKNDIADEYKRMVHDDQNKENVPVERQKGHLSDEERSARKSEFKRANAPKTPYNSLYEVSEDVDDQNKELLDMQEIIANEEAEEYRKAHVNTPPRVIPDNEIDEVTFTYKEEPLYYYVEDGVLVDDFDNIIDDPEQLVGDTLETSGFDVNDVDMINVQNYQLEVVYNIQKFEGSFFSEK